MIRLEGLHKTLGNTAILRDLSLHVRAGEIFVIVGQSGVGKSVTLKHIVGLMKPDSGTVRVDGVEVGNATEAELHKVRGEIGLVFQSGALVNWLSVEDNISLPLRERLGLPAAEIRERVEESLAQVHLEGQEKKMPADLSGGMKKRVGIARAIVTRPRILLYDEPTSGLDPVTAKAIDELILETRAANDATSVVVSHDLTSVFRIADRIGMIHDGRMVAIGTPEELRKCDEEIVRNFLSAGLPTMTRRATGSRDAPAS